MDRLFMISKKKFDPKGYSDTAMGLYTCILYTCMAVYMFTAYMYMIIIVKQGHWYIYTCISDLRRAIT